MFSTLHYNGIAALTFTGQLVPLAMRMLKSFAAQLRHFSRVPAILHWHAQHGGRRSMPAPRGTRCLRCATICGCYSRLQLTTSLTDCHIWFNFFHRGLFFQSFFGGELGAHVVFGVMAHMTLLRAGMTKTGQLRALHFAEEARRMVNYCLTANNRDPTLAQTALLLVAFEFLPHIHQNLARTTAALGFMEACARSCLPYWSTSADSSAVTDRSAAAARTSSIRREEMRQMCWTLSHLAASSTIWRHLVAQPPLYLSSADHVKVRLTRIVRVANRQFAELFPANLFDADRKAPKMHGWSIYCAAICLW